ncbi:MAG: RNA polymerase sigma factor [Terriglobia bacterium]
MEQSTISESSQHSLTAMLRVDAPSRVVPARPGVAPMRTRSQNPCTRRVADPQETKQRVAELPRRGGGFDFERIYQMHSRSVFTLCLRMVGDRSEAEDLTQDAFLQLFRKLHTFRGESAFRTWLFRLVTNVALMHLRKKKRLMMQESPLDDNHGVGEEGDAPRRELGVTDQTLAGANDRVILERAIQGLAPGYRRVFLLHDLEGYIHTEISAILGLGIGTSKSQLHKARRHLRRLLRTARR